MKHENLAIFIPFAGCPHRCTFCDQQRITGSRAAPSVSQIITLIKNCASRPQHRADTAQIAFFGGSFTCLPEKQRLAYLEAAAPFVENGSFSGIRISTRPDGINEEILHILCRYPVKAVELGAQSMDPEVLRLANRGHTPEDTIKASRLIHQAGLSLGLQMLLGLPGDAKETAYQSAVLMAALKPEEMRLYPAVVFPKTALYDAYIKGVYQPLSVEEAVCWTVPIAMFLQNKGIRLLKVGLHQAEGAVAGAFHPAFGELVRTGILNKRLEKLLPPPPCRLSIRVPPRELSIALGQKKKNLQYWHSRGYDLHFTADPNAISLLYKQSP